MRTRTEYKYDNQTGVYLGEETNALTYRDTDFYPLPWCVLAEPKPPTGKIAVINADKTAWTYKPDVSGVWYDTATGAEIMLTSADYERDTSALTRSKPGELQKWSGSAWVDDAAAKAKAGIAVIDGQIAELENKTYRPLREIALGAGANGAAVKKLSEINAAVSKLRAQRVELSAIK